MAQQRLYAVVDDPGMVGRFPPTVTSGFRTVRHKPRKVADLRYRPVATLEAVLDAVDSFYRRRGERPDSIRLTRATKAALGNPTHIYGIKVTL